MKQLIISLSLALCFCCHIQAQAQHDKILSHIVDPSLGKLSFYWKNEDNKNFRNHQQLAQWLENQGQELVFAMNGGMYLKDLKPQGLYIENYELIRPLDTLQDGYGNFYLQPNGVFLLTENNEPIICPTIEARQKLKNIKFGTQSGPLLLIDGKVHPKLTKGSKNLHIRNGVGILPDGKLLFAMSKEKINFYDFAQFFLNHQCKNALYLDGFVSRTYLPSKNWIQTDGNFGVIIGEVKD